MTPRAEAPDASSSPSPLAVRLRGIRKRFGFREALRGVDLDLLPGRCALLFGPNGAGKSTLLRVVATQQRPSAGTGEVLGLDLTRDTRAIRGRIGFVAHQPLLRPEFSLDENLRFAADLYDVALDEANDHRLEALGLATRRREPVRNLSQGMRKRASIARSLVHGPELWLLDEPFSGLDPDGRELLGGMLRSHAEGGGTVLLVTHHLDLGRRFAEDLWEVRDGRLHSAEGARHGESAA